MTDVKAKEKSLNMEFDNRLINPFYDRRNEVHKPLGLAPARA